MAQGSLWPKKRKGGLQKGVTRTDRQEVMLAQRGDSCETEQGWVGIPKEDPAHLLVS